MILRRLKLRVMSWLASVTAGALIAFTVFGVESCAVARLVGITGSEQGDGIASPMQDVQQNLTLQVTYSAEGQPYGYLAARPSLVNLSQTDTLRLVWGGCPVLDFKAFDAPDHSGTPSWDMSEVGPINCPTVLTTGPIPPGGSLTLRSQPLFATPEAISAKGGPGTYYFTASVFLAGPNAPNDRYTLKDLPAGSVVLP